MTPVEALKLASELRKYADGLDVGGSYTVHMSAATIEALAAKVAELQAGEKVRQRLRDLVRHQRAELYEAELISTEEYARLLSEEGSVARLETYDDMLQRIQTLESQSAAMRSALETTLHCAEKETLADASTLRDALKP